MLASATPASPVETEDNCRENQRTQGSQHFTLAEAESLARIDAERRQTCKSERQPQPGSPGDGGAQEDERDHGNPQAGHAGEEAGNRRRGRGQAPDLEYVAGEIEQSQRGPQEPLPARRQQKKSRPDDRKQGQGQD